MPFSVNEIRGAMKLDGARPSQFTVQITNPFENNTDLASPLNVTAASMPASIVGQVQVPYFGRIFNLAGDREYENWTVLINNDEDFVLRNAFEYWAFQINSPEGNVRANPGLGYKSSAIVSQYNKTGTDIIREYRMDGIFPLQVGAIDLNWGRRNEIETFQVTFSVDLFVPLNSATGNAGGGGA